MRLAKVHWAALLPGLHDHHIHLLALAAAALVLLPCLPAKNSFNRAFHLLICVPIAGYERTLRVGHTPTTRTHDFTVNELSAGVIYHVELIKLSADNASVHLAFCVFFRHQSLQSRKNRLCRTLTGAVGAPWSGDYR